MRGDIFFLYVKVEGKVLMKCGPFPFSRPETNQLLGELLLDRHNFTIMTKYISKPENLKLMMNLLRDKSRNIQFEAFHVFKVRCEKHLWKQKSHAPVHLNRLWKLTSSTAFTYPTVFPPSDFLCYRIFFYLSRRTAAAAASRSERKASYVRQTWLLQSGLWIFSYV